MRTIIRSLAVMALVVVAAGMMFAQPKPKIVPVRPNDYQATITVDANTGVSGAANLANTQIGQIAIVETSAGQFQLGDRITLKFGAAGASNLSFLYNGLNGLDPARDSLLIVIKGGGGLRLTQGGGNNTFHWLPGSGPIDSISFTVSQKSTLNPDTIYISNIRFLVNSGNVSGAPYTDSLIVHGTYAGGTGFNFPSQTAYRSAKITVNPGAAKKLAYKTTSLTADVDTLHAGVVYNFPAYPATGDSIEIQDAYGNKILPSQDTYTVTATSVRTDGSVITGTRHPSQNIQDLVLSGQGTGGRRLLSLYFERMTFRTAADSFTTKIKFSAAGVATPAQSQYGFRVRSNVPYYATVTNTVSGNFPVTLQVGQSMNLTATFSDYWLNQIIQDSLWGYGVEFTGTKGVVDTASILYNADGSVIGVTYTAQTFPAPATGSVTVKAYKNNPEWPGISSPPGGPNYTAVFTGRVNIVPGPPTAVAIYQVDGSVSNSAQVPVLTGTDASTRNVIPIKARLFDIYSNPVYPDSANEVTYKIEWAKINKAGPASADPDTAGFFSSGNVLGTDSTISISYTVPKYAHNNALDSNYVKISVLLPSTGFADTAYVGLYSGPAAQHLLVKHGLLWGDPYYNKPDTLVVSYWTNNTALEHNLPASGVNPPLDGVTWQSGSYNAAYKDSVWDAFGNLLNKWRYATAVTFSIYQTGTAADTILGSFASGNSNKITKTVGIADYGVSQPVNFYSGKRGGFGAFGSRGTCYVKADIGVGSPQQKTVQVVSDDIAGFAYKNYSVGTGSVGPLTDRAVSNVPAGAPVKVGAWFYDRFANPIPVDRSVTQFNWILRKATWTSSVADSGSCWLATIDLVNPAGLSNLYNNFGESGVVAFGWRTAFQKADTVKVQLLAKSYRTGSNITWADTVAIYNLPPGAIDHFVFATDASTPAPYYAGDQVKIVVWAYDANNNLIRSARPIVPIQVVGASATAPQALTLKDSTYNPGPPRGVYATRAVATAGFSDTLVLDGDGKTVFYLKNNKAEGPVKLQLLNSSSQSPGYTWLPAPIAAFDLKVLTYPGQQPTDTVFAGKKFYLQITPLDQYGNQNLTDSILAAIGARYQTELTPQSYFAPTYIKGVTLFDFVPTAPRNDQRIYCYDYPFGVYTGAVDFRVLNNAPLVFTLLAPANGDSLKLNSYAQTFDFNWNATTTPFNTSGWGLLDTVTYKFVIQGTGPYAAVKHEVSAGSATHVTLAAGTESSPGTLMYLLKQVAANTYAFVWYAEASNGTFTTQSAPFTVVVTKRGIVSVKEGQEIPKEFSISQNYPNPFNPTTTIKFGVPKASPVTLEIYNILGEKVRTLLNGENFEPGYWTVNWDGKDNAGLSVPSGIYFYRIVAGDFVKTMKMMMLK